MDALLRAIEWKDKGNETFRLVCNVCAPLEEGIEVNVFSVIRSKNSSHITVQCPRCGAVRIITQ